MDSSIVEELMTENQSLRELLLLAREPAAQEDLDQALRREELLLEEFELQAQSLKLEEVETLKVRIEKLIRSEYEKRW
jgi:hypothetical protein